MITYTLDDIDELEQEVDIPAQPQTTGSLRPQAMRQARARRSALLRRLT